MKKLLSLMLAVMLVLGLAGSVQAEELTGIAKGFGGEVTVTVTVEDGKITAVTAKGDNETPGIGSKALEELPAKIVEAGSTEVDVIATATVTSNAIKAAVNNALDPVAYPYVVEEKAAPEKVVAEAADAFMGLGVASMGRLGPGKDDQDVQVYGFNQVVAGVVFDAEGRILMAKFDQLEVSTPNYDGATMPHLSGFPGQEGYNLDSDHDGKVDGKTENTNDGFLAEVAAWQTKRERGEGYVMGTGYWAQQMDHFERLFMGKTVEEVKAWFAAYCSDRNGRPLQAGSSNEQDAAKYDALSDEEKAMLADVTAGATMSLNDSHGDLLAALEKAYENRVPLNIESASAMGLGVANMGRLGPGSDDKEVQVYSFNDVYAFVLFAEDGSVAASIVDQLEVATPNYDGATMPHFTGFPGMGGYNYDSDHDGKVDSVLDNDNDAYLAEIAAWQTKRERGEGYVMGTGYWAQQMDRFQEVFAGKTVAEINDWFAAYCSDRNGRPLKAGSSNEQDAAKYDALSDEAKTMLADVTAGATMSLNDGHGNILAALEKAEAYKVEVELNIAK